jgi:hypothetical protein
MGAAGSWSTHFLPPKEQWNLRFANSLVGEGSSTAGKKKPTAYFRLKGELGKVPYKDKSTKIHLTRYVFFHSNGHLGPWFFPSKYILTHYAYLHALGPVFKQ